MTGPGALNRRLVLEAPVETPDGAGGVVRGYAEAATLWAEVVPLSARELLVAAAAGASVTHRVRIRRRDGVTTRHRLRWGARILRIASLREDPSARFLLIEAEERRE